MTTIATKPGVTSGPPSAPPGPGGPAPFGSGGPGSGGPGPGGFPGPIPAPPMPAVSVPDAVLDVDGALRAEIEQFLYFEAELLDERRFPEWLSLCADDIAYWMPLRRNRTSREVSKETSTRGELSHFDENKKSLGWRVGQLLTGMHWAEDPPSRTRHLVTNVRVLATADAEEYQVRSNFLCYRNRLDHDVDIFAGERTDVLRRIAPRTWQIARRTILLDQSVILSKNLSIFF